MNLASPVSRLSAVIGTAATLMGCGGDGHSQSSGADHSSVGPAACGKATATQVLGVVRTISSATASTVENPFFHIVRVKAPRFGLFDVYIPRPGVDARVLTTDAERAIRELGHTEPSIQLPLEDGVYWQYLALKPVVDLHTWVATRRYCENVYVKWYSKSRRLDDRFHRLDAAFGPRLRDVVLRAESRGQ